MTLKPQFLSSSLLMVCLVTGMSASAENGKPLPKGPILPSKPTVAPVSKEPAGPPAPKPYDCYAYEASPPGSTHFFGAEGQFFYFLGTEPDDSKAHAKDGLRKSILYRIDLLTAKSVAIFSARLKPMSALIPIGQTQVRGATVVSFRTGIPGCFTGSATGVSLVLTPQSSTTTSKAVKSLPLGEYRLVYGEDGARIVDTKIGNVKEIDSDTFQQRSAQTFPKNQVPLFASSRRNRLVMLEPGAQNYLRLYSGGRAKADEELVLQSGWRVLESGPWLALVNWTAGTISIKEFPTWTEATKEEIFKVGFDPKVDVNKASMSVNFKNQILILYGSRSDVRESWRRAYVIHYKTNRVIGKLDIPEGQYVSGAAIDPDGERAVLLLNSTKEQYHVGAKGFDFVKKTWTDYPLP